MSKPTATSRCGREDVYLLSCVRTPIGSFGGKLSSFSATQLGTIAIQAALSRAHVNVEEVDECYMGNVISANLGQAPARQAARGANLPDSVPCTTVNKVCSSGLKAVMMAAQSIQGGHQHCIVAGGMESMSNIPYYLPKHRFGSKFGDAKVIDGLRKDGLSDAYGEYAMGICAEKCATDYNIDRKTQDEYTIQSYRRSQQSTSQHYFQNEIVPVTLPRNKGIMDQDEEVFRLKDFNRVSKARAAFKKGGSVTAANASTISDGAAVCVLMSGSECKRRNASPVARIVSYCDAAQAPDDFTTAPALAVKKLLAKVNMSIDQIDVWEINEAFSVVAVANQRLLEIPSDKLNVLGGSVSLGHPLGASGARILTTLVSALQLKQGRFGVAAICNGGGGASAVLIELVSSSSLRSKL